MEREQELFNQAFIYETQNDTDKKHEDDWSDDKQGLNKQRKILPKEKETIIEMRIYHEDLNEEKIETFISLFPSVESFP